VTIYELIVTPKPEPNTQAECVVGMNTENVGEAQHFRLASRRFLDFDPVSSHPGSLLR
jgi:hypothetical protein